jgi:hypothetical protein
VLLTLWGAYACSGAVELRHPLSAGKPFSAGRADMFEVEVRR